MIGVMSGENEFETMIVVVGDEYPTAAELSNIGAQGLRDSGWLSTGNLQQMKLEPGIDPCAYANYSLLRVSERCRSMIHSSKLAQNPCGYSYDSWRPWASGDAIEHVDAGTAKSEPAATDDDEMS